jgi:hypothetical protein
MTLHEASLLGIRIKRKSWDQNLWLVGMLWRYVRMNDVNGEQITYYLTPDDIKANDWTYEDPAIARERAKRAVSFTVTDFDEVAGLP